MLSLLDRKDQIISSTERKHQDLRTLQSAKFRNQGNALEQVGVRSEVSYERVRAELDRLRRTEGQLGNFGIGFPIAPSIESISSVKYSRSSVVLNERSEPGNDDTTTYEVIFSDGNRQIVESRVFVPLRR